jgi:probable phosphoglycerate mutase
MRLILARHGETAWNQQGRYQGQIDIDLSAEGERQARALGERLRAIEIDRAVSSPLSRSRRTAELALGAERTALLTLDPGFAEIAHGEWEGKLASEIAALDSDRLVAWRREPHTVQMPGGESIEQVRARAWAALERASGGLGAEQTLFVVAHDAVNRALICQVLGLPLARLWSFRQAPATTNLLEGPTLAQLEVVRLNDAAHVAALFGEAVHRSL